MLSDRGHARWIQWLRDNLRLTFMSPDWLSHPVRQAAITLIIIIIIIIIIS